MAKTLVVYFTLTNHTKQVAEEIERQLHADIEQIVDSAGRTFSAPHMFWFVMESLLQQSPDIRDVSHDPSEYDLVVIGTPVWAGSVATPVRTYIERYKAQFLHLAAFCTEGGARGEHALKQIAELAEQQPVAQLIVNEGELTSGAYRAKVESFVRSVQKTPA